MIRKNFCLSYSYLMFSKYFWFQCQLLSLSVFFWLALYSAIVSAFLLSYQHNNLYLEILYFCIRISIYWRLLYFFLFKYPIKTDTPILSGISANIDVWFEKTSVFWHTDFFSLAQFSQYFPYGFCFFGNQISFFYI